jgi:hypothetical protein
MANHYFYFDPINLSAGVSSPAALGGFPDINGIDASPQSSVKASATGAYTYTLTLSAATAAEKIVILGVPELVFDNVDITAVTKNTGGATLETLSPLADASDTKAGLWLSTGTGEIVQRDYRDLVFTPSVTGIKTVVLTFATKGGGTAQAAEFGKVLIFRQKYEIAKQSDTEETTDGWTLIKRTTSFDTGATVSAFQGERYQFSATVTGAAYAQTQKMRTLSAGPVCFLPDGELGRIFYGHIEYSAPVRLGAELYNYTFAFTAVI